MRARGIAGGLFVIAATACAAPAATAAAQGRSMFGIDAEVGGNFLLDSTNSELFAAGGGGTLDFEFNALPALGIHVGGLLSHFTSGDSQQSTLYVGGHAGLRLHWGTIVEGFAHDGWLDLHGTYGTSGGIARPGVDGGLGFAFHLAYGVRLGPYLRVSWANDPLGNDPVWLTAGIELQLFGDPRVAPEPDVTEAPSDTDADGVLDTADFCPTVPAGAQADPARAGCPFQVPACPAGSTRTAVGCTSLDADADGVPDTSDLCPTSPAGDHPDPERAGCPDGDDDADAVLNHVDLCRTQPAGVHPDPARRGCPLPDRDDDFIPDPTDACPDQPGAPNRDPARNGCPGQVVVTGGQIRISQAVFFATRRDRILSRSIPVLTAVAEAMLASPVIERVSIEGHTDDVGDDGFNLELSQRRAANVMAFLVQHGVPPDRLEAHGYGETIPMIRAPTSDARAANRRVEFRLIRAHGQVVGEAPGGGTVIGGGPAPSR